MKSLEENSTKSLKGRLIGGEDLLCEGAMAVLATLSSFLVILVFVHNS